MFPRMKSSSARSPSQGSDRQFPSAIRYHFYGRPDGRRRRRWEQNGRVERYSRQSAERHGLVVPLAQIVEAGRLTEIPGIGDAIADIVTKLHRTGTHPSLEAMRKEIPAGVLEMLAVPGLRPDKVLKLYKSLGITSLAHLEQAAREDRIKGAKGLGGALQAKILRNLEIARSGEGRLHMHRAAMLSSPLVCRATKARSARAVVRRWVVVARKRKLVDHQNKAPPALSAGGSLV